MTEIRLNYSAKLARILVILVSIISCEQREEMMKNDEKGK